MLTPRIQSSTSYQQGQRKNNQANNNKKTCKKSNTAKAALDNSITAKKEEIKNYSQWENKGQTQAQH